MDCQDAHFFKNKYGFRKNILNISSKKAFIRSTFSLRYNLYVLSDLPLCRFFFSCVVGQGAIHERGWRMRVRHENVVKVVFLRLKTKIIIEHSPFRNTDIWLSENKKTSRPI